MKYLRPRSLEQALEMFAEGGTLLAGGTDLLPRYELGASLPDRLIDLKHVPELHGIGESNGGLELGALTTVHELLTNDLVRARFAALAESARDFAAVQIRHRATLGGNLCNASPAGDTITPLAAFGAELKVADSKGDRTIPIAHFFDGPGQTTLKKGELVRTIWIPKPLPHSRFFKLGLRDAMAISVVNAAVAAEIAKTENGRIFTELKIAAGAVAPTVVTLDSYAKSVLENPENINKHVDLIDSDISPIDDIRATASYRSRVLKSLLAQTLTEMLESDDE
jgi:CO/xanthine dehydrogenase FAD-binding subunit